jgi:hypothetical protein
VLPCWLIRPMPRPPRPRCEDIPEAARALGLQIQVVKASTSRKIEAAFATLVRDRADALFVGPDGFGASNLRHSRRAIESPRAMPLARLSKPAG